MLLMIALMLPFFFLAMYERDGLPAEKVLRNILRATILTPRVRPYRTDDISFILYQGRLEQRGHNYTIIKSKANSVILLLKMLLTNKI